MMTIPFALSLHSLKDSFGADAAFLAILGLAVLTVLYFAQARETRTLRETLERAEQEITALSARLEGFARAQAAAVQSTVAPAPRPPVAARPMGSAVQAARQTATVAALSAAGAGAASAALSALELPPAAPAGLGAPALSSATKLIPTVVPAAAHAASGPPLTVIGAPGALPPDATVIGGLPPAPVAGPNGGVLAPSTAAAAAGVAAVAERPVAAAGAPPAASPVPAPSSAGAGSGPPAAPEGAARSDSGAPPRRTAPPPRSGARRQRSVAARLAPWLVGAAALGVGVAALLILTGGNGQPNPSSVTGHNVANTQTGASTARHRPRHAAFDPRTVTVAVLNGTQVFHLANDTAQKLTSVGYRQGAVTDAATQTQVSTLVGYTAGHREDALHVARVLGLGRSAVGPIDPTNLQVACQGASHCDADVVVVIGQDLANAQTTTT